MAMTRRFLLPLILALPLAAQTLPRPSGNLTIKLPFGQTSLADYKGKVIVFAIILTG